MPPIRSYSGWNARSSNKTEQVEPYKHYYFICEGQNTERWYFEKFIDLRKEFSIPSLISVEYLEKTGQHQRWSDPKKLLELANEFRKSKGASFDPERDTIILVFDTDIYEAKEASVYTDFIQNASKENTLCVTNPSFELFLLLHYENSYNELISPNSENLLKNDWVNVDKEKIRYMEALFREKSGLKPKENPEIAELVRNINTAISQEEKLNQDPLQCRGRLTSNIGLIMKRILNDKCEETNRS